jgi:hypothetical protein
MKNMCEDGNSVIARHVQGADTMTTMAVQNVKLVAGAARRLTNQMQPF